VLWGERYRQLETHRERRFRFDEEAPCIRPGAREVACTTCKAQLTDDDCCALLQRVEPKLVPHFDREKKGAYKADICRVAALFEEGGYYFDIDIRVITPVRLADGAGAYTHPLRSST